MVPERRDRELILFAVAALLGGVLLLWLLYLLRAVLLVVYISVLLAMGLSPAVRWIEHQSIGRKARPMPRWAAILVLYGTFLTVVALVLAMIVPPIAHQIQMLGQRMPEYLDTTQRFMASRGWISAEWTWTDFLKNVQSPGVAVKGVLGAVQNVVGGIGTVITLLVLPYYLMVDGGALLHSLLRVVAPERRDRIERLTSNVAIKVGAWLSGQLFLCLVIGTAVTIAMWAFGVPFFYVLGLIAAVGEAVPVVGPILSAVPAILIAATVSLKTAVFVALLFLVIQFCENNLLVPRVMQRQVGLRTAIVLVALLSGSTLLGMAGALLAVPTAAIVQVLVEEFLQNPEETKKS